MSNAPLSTPRQFKRFAIALTCLALPEVGLTLYIVTDIGPLRTLAPSCVIAFALYWWYFRVSWKVYTERTVPTGGGRPTASPSEMRSLMEQLEDTMTTELAEFYVQMVLDPARHTIRVTDRISPASRAYNISRNMKVVVPAHLAGSRVPVPLDVISKASLVNSLQVQSQSGEAASTLSQDATIAHSALVVRRLVFKACVRSARQEYERDIEPDVIAFLCRNRLVSLHDAEFTRLISRISHLSDDPWTRKRLLVIVSYLQVLSSHYPLVVYVKASEDAISEELVPGECVRVSISRRTIPVVGRGMSGWDRSRARFRSLFGIRPVNITWSLAPALRARSYHLECMGPEGSYLARQLVYSDSADGTALLRELNYKLLPRHGQRFSHLYVHDLRPMSQVASLGGSNSLNYVAWFYERPPGSTAPAAVSALTAALLISAAGYKRLVLGTDPGDGTDLVAILLALPVVASAWLGFGAGGPSVFLGALGARVALFSTMACSLVASLMYLRPQPELHKCGTWCWWEQPTSTAWITIGTLIWLTAIAAGLSWFLRVTTHQFFVRRADISRASGRER